MAERDGNGRLATPDRVVLLLSLVPYLSEHGDTPLDELASAFDVDVLTMRGLVEFLGTAGAPGETGTYQDDDLFDIDWAALDDEGIVRLTRAVVVEDAPRFSTMERAALIAGLNALISMLPEHARTHAESAAAKLRSGESEALSTSNQPHDPALALVANAVEARDRLAFTYRDVRGTQSDRTVDPIALVQAGSGWYLRAFCQDRRAERTFALEGMRDPRILSSPSDVPAHPVASSPSAIAADASLPAELKVRASSLHRIQSFQPSHVEPAEEGWLRVRVKLIHPGAAVRIVQAAPGDVFVESPSAARDAVLHWAELALAQYDA